MRSLDVLEDEIARLRKTGKAQRRIAVRAPADGVVIEKPAQEGMRIEAGQPLYKRRIYPISGSSPRCRSRNLGLVHPARAPKRGSRRFPGRNFDGTVEFIYPSLSPETRTALVRIVIPNPDQVLRAAMDASVEIATPAAAGPVLAIPSSAVIDSGARQVVLIDRGEGRFEPRPRDHLAGAGMISWALSKYCMNVVQSANCGSSRDIARMCSIACWPWSLMVG
jgi:Cu(I)/Ag(I) efflux system membrane fusion protein